MSWLSETEEIRVPLTEKELGYICCALNYWSQENQHLSEEDFDKITTLIDKLANEIF